MARKPRSFQTQQSLVFHVLNRGILKQPIFHNEEDYADFLKVLKRYLDGRAAIVYHWCLMPNHYHIVTELPSPATLSKLIGGVQQVYAARYHFRHNTAGRLFQNRFKSQAIEKDTYLLACGRYIERNPARAGLVDKPWDWPWSSAAFYAEGTVDTITTPDPIWKGKYGGEYKEWLLLNCVSEENLLRSSTLIIGRQAFQKQFVERKGRLAFDRRGRKLEQ